LGRGSAVYTAHRRLAGGDRRLAIEEPPGALDDRDVDHFAVDGDGADALRESIVVRRDNAVGMIGLLGARPELLVPSRHISGEADDAVAREPVDCLAI
jgi:hypothetical protein